MNDMVFFSIWRNRYLRGYIRNKVCQDLVFKIKSLTDLHDNYQFLSLFTEQDKIENSIYFNLNINDIDEYNQYNSTSNSEFKHVVNDIKIRVSRINLDFNQIHQGVHRLFCYFNEQTTWKGTLPQSLTDLTVYSDRGMTFSNIELDGMLSKLPTSLLRLVLPYNYCVATRVEITSVLVDIECRGKASNIRNMVVVPSNRVYPQYIVDIGSLDDLQWVHSAPWITKLDIYKLDTDVLRCSMIPSHIKDLNIHFDGVVEDGAFPQSLTTLSYLSAEPITRLAVLPHQHLSYLHLFKLGQQLDKGILPSTLQTLVSTYYDLPLLPGVLPENLTSLTLITFDQQLDVGVLPHSLIHLSLSQFQQVLKPHVLPTRLKTLALYSFIGNIVTNVLPSTLTHLELPQSRRSLKHAPQMNNLSLLFISTLDQSVSRVIHNANNIKIICQSIDHTFNLQNSSIQHLDIKFNHGKKDRKPLFNFLPNQIKSLVLVGFDINSKGLIPITCINLKTDIKDLNITLIPSTTNHQKIKK